MNRSASLSDELVQIAPNGWANPAGVAYIEAIRRMRPISHNACVQGPVWPCPHMPNPPCLERQLKKARQRALAVTIYWSDWQKELVPVGQMTLDRPHQTHQVFWRHPFKRWRFKEGAYPPLSWGSYSCKAKAAEMVLYLRKIHTDATLWRVLPFEDDPAWLAEQQAANAGRLPGCVFDFV